MSSASWVVVILGLIASIIAVQFDEPWLELAGTAGFVGLFAWVVVALRARTDAVKAELLRRPSSFAQDPTRPPRDS